MHLFPLNNSGGTSIVPTVGDLMRWHSALFGGVVLSPPVFQEMTSPGTLKNGERIVTPLSDGGYGYGLFLINFMGHQKIGQRAIREIMIFLHANGVGTSRARVRIYKPMAPKGPG
jgi:hypothetical protein